MHAHRVPRHIWIDFSPFPGIGHSTDPPAVVDSHSPSGHGGGLLPQLVAHLAHVDNRLLRQAPAAQHLARVHMLAVITRVVGAHEEVDELGRREDCLGPGQGERGEHAPCLLHVGPPAPQTDAHLERELRAARQGALQATEQSQRAHEWPRLDGSCDAVQRRLAAEALQKHTRTMWALPVLQWGDDSTLQHVEHVPGTQQLAEHHTSLLNVLPKLQRRHKRAEHAGPLVAHRGHQLDGLLRVPVFEAQHELRGRALVPRCQSHELNILVIHGTRRDHPDYFPAASARECAPGEGAAPFAQDLEQAHIR
mmetsp:Transcript_22441/g.43593  ORF Transcript_22441/g.43593 Transcript_22441/m.43593 type:complete len:308 (+) Transcript_22441:419-1342(+)